MNNAIPGASGKRPSTTTLVLRPGRAPHDGEYSAGGECNADASSDKGGQIEACRGRDRAVVPSSRGRRPSTTDGSKEQRRAPWLELDLHERLSAANLRFVQARQRSSRPGHESVKPTLLSLASPHGVEQKTPTLPPPYHQPEKTSGVEFLSLRPSSRIGVAFRRCEQSALRQVVPSFGRRPEQRPKQPARRDRIETTRAVRAKKYDVDKCRKPQLAAERTRDVHYGLCVTGFVIRSWRASWTEWTDYHDDDDEEDTGYPSSQWRRDTVENFDVTRTWPGVIHIDERNKMKARRGKAEMGRERCREEHTEQTEPTEATETLYRQLMRRRLRGRERVFPVWHLPKNVPKRPHRRWHQHRVLADTRVPRIGSRRTRRRASRKMLLRHK
eukprot:scaffold1651_cov317-Pinguiococcus_pyrenoidosus.AAC.29